MRPVTEDDLRMPEFRGKNLDEYEFRADGQIVRKDRWEQRIHKLHSILHLIHDREFEIEDLLDEVRALVRLKDNALELLTNPDNVTTDNINEFLEEHYQ